jgi:hypothetical protein
MEKENHLLKIHDIYNKYINDSSYVYASMATLTEDWILIFKKNEETENNNKNKHIKQKKHNLSVVCIFNKVNPNTTLDLIKNMYDSSVAFNVNTEEVHDDIICFASIESAFYFGREPKKYTGPWKLYDYNIGMLIGEVNIENGERKGTWNFYHVNHPIENENFHLAWNDINPNDVKREYITKFTY